MAKIYLKTYGCQMNERDSEQVARMLVERGHEMTLQHESADVVLLNTCSVRDQAEQKALGKMRSVELSNRQRSDRDQVIYAFMGCMAQSRGSQLLEENPKVSLVVGTQKFHRAADHIEHLLHLRSAGAETDDLRQAIVDVDEELGSQSTIKDHQLKPRQSTAFVSIMQGCNMNCSYCIVPATRGRERGRPLDEVENEVRVLVDQGVREVTLLGQIVNLYGRHEFEKVDGKSPFVQLLHRLDRIPGLRRLRFTSPHPVGFRDDLIDCFGSLETLCEHVHFPLQSGSNRILKAMRRTYTVEKYMGLTEKLRAVRPDIAVTTDIIVGYPGETEEDYLATRMTVEQAHFDNAFIFRFSPRRDTVAATLPEQVPAEVKEARNQDLLSVVNHLARSKMETFVGGPVEVLCEGPSKTRADRLQGRTRQNKIVIFEGNQRLIGELFEVHIHETTGFTLYGRPDVISHAA